MLRESAEVCQENKEGVRAIGSCDGATRAVLGVALVLEAEEHIYVAYHTKRCVLKLRYSFHTVLIKPPT